MAADDPDLGACSARLVVPVEHKYGTGWSKVIDRTFHDDYWTNSQFHPLRMSATGGLSKLVCQANGGHCAEYAGLEECDTTRSTFLRPLPGRGATTTSNFIPGASPNATATSDSPVGGTPAYRAFAVLVNRLIEALAGVPQLVEQHDLTALALENNRPVNRE